MSGERLSRVQDMILRQAAFSIEQMAPGGIDRGDPGVVRPTDIDNAQRRLEGILARPNGAPAGREDPKRKAVQLLMQRSQQLAELMLKDRSIGVVYLSEREHTLQPRLRSAAIEIDFCFGDKDGVVSQRDIQEARRRYGEVRGPVGWNRLLLTDEIERQLFPDRTLRTTEGLRLLPEDWLVDGPDPTIRLRKVSIHLDDAALARTYADIAARLATVAARDPTSQLSRIFEDALVLLGQQIRERNSVRPTITDIARIGCEDPEIKALLATPIEMSRKLKPASLIDRYLAM